jgi:hypothetical protein
MEPARLRAVVQHVCSLTPCESRFINERWLLPMMKRATRAKTSCLTALKSALPRPSVISNYCAKFWSGFSGLLSAVAEFTTP